ncbi:unnamed protein product [Linum trigynum]|uniref:Uncharacterized protein n=1 Tax=Linum trigynum TaxID=586398 RepID=A0AAV2CS54_9ROSI
MRQQMAKQNEVIADMQRKMNQVIALMMSKEAAPAAHVEPIAPRQVAGEAPVPVPAPELVTLPPADAPPAREVQQAEPRDRENLGFLEQHLSPQYRPHPPRRILHQPLSKEIMAEHLSGMPPALPTYNETSDPEDHVSTFCLRMQLQTNSNVALCITFPSTFSGICLDWYNRLPNGIICSFEEFILLFTIKFT